MDVSVFFSCIYLGYLAFFFFFYPYVSIQYRYM